MQVPFFDWKSLYLEKEEEFSKIISKTLKKGAFILQADVSNFEEKLRNFLDIKHVVAVADGTNAILLGLRASGVRVGDEVILPSHSFIAAAQSIYHVGARPVPVEMSEEDWLISTEAIEAAITENTVGIMPVHVNGRCCQMDYIMDIAERYNLKVFEDSAQAMGAKHDGRSAGSMGDWGTYSFYPSKTLGCFGDAGALVTNSDEIYEKVLAMRNHGADENKTIPLETNIWGTNCRLDNVQAAILSFKMEYYIEVIERRRQIAQAYHDTLNKYSDVRLPPAPSDNGKNFDIFQNYEFCTPKRDDLRKFLGDNGVGTIIQWGGFGIHMLENLGLKANLPLTDKFFKESLLLPLNHVMTDPQVEFVCELLNKFFSGDVYG